MSDYAIVNPTYLKNWDYCKQYKNYCPAELTPMGFDLKFINISVIMLPTIFSMGKRETNMKLIIFGIVILLSLQGCTLVPGRYIESCHSYTASSAVNKKNEKQCKKDKEILTDILGEGGLEAENNRRDLTNLSIVLSPLVVAFAVLSKS